jgi:hypothetical protein
MGIEVKRQDYTGEEIPPYGKKCAGTHSKRRWFLISIAASICAILVLGWFPSPASRNIPSELIGIWRTSDPRYGDRYIEIDPVSISFGTGNATLTNGFVKHVEVIPERSRTLYTISYTNNDETGQCSFYYIEEKERTIYLKNQSGIAWTKDH